MKTRDPLHSSIVFDFCYSQSIFIHFRLTFTKSGQRDSGQTIKINTLNYGAIDLTGITSGRYLSTELNLRRLLNRTRYKTETEFHRWLWDGLFRDYNNSINIKPASNWRLLQEIREGQTKPSNLCNWFTFCVSSLSSAKKWISKFHYVVYVWIKQVPWDSRILQNSLFHLNSCTEGEDSLFLTAFLLIDCPIDDLPGHFGWFLQSSRLIETYHITHSTSSARSSETHTFNPTSPKHS